MGGGKNASSRSLVQTFLAQSYFCSNADLLRFMGLRSWACMYDPKCMKTVVGAMQANVTCKTTARLLHEVRCAPDGTPPSTRPRGSESIIWTRIFFYVFLRGLKETEGQHGMPSLASALRIRKISF